MEGDFILCISVIICDFIKSLLCSPSDIFSRLECPDLLVLFLGRNCFVFLIVVTSALDI